MPKRGFHSTIREKPERIVLHLLETPWIFEFFLDFLLSRGKMI